MSRGDWWNTKQLGDWWNEKRADNWWNQAGANVNGPVDGGGGPPVVVTQPASQTVDPDDEVTMTSTATGSGTIVGQWQLNDGGGWVDISGEVADDYVFTAAEGDDGKQYRRSFTNEGEPTSYSNANTANGSGSGQKIAQVAMSSTDFTIGDGDTSGRKVACAAKSAVSVATAGDGSYVAYLDTSNTRILHYYELSAARNGLTTADTVNFPAHDYEIRDVAAEA